MQICHRLENHSCPSRIDKTSLYTNRCIGNKFFWRGYTDALYRPQVGAQPTGAGARYPRISFSAFKWDTLCQYAGSWGGPQSNRRHRPIFLLWNAPTVSRPSRKVFIFIQIIINGYLSSTLLRSFPILVRVLFARYFVGKLWYSYTTISPSKL